VLKNIALLLILNLQFYLFAGDDNTENLWIKKIIDYSINTNFYDAESIIKERLNSGDSSYVTYFYYASVLSSKMTHYENFNDEENFRDAVSRVIQTTDSLIFKSNGNCTNDLADIYFFRGSAYGYLAYFQSQKGEWYKAMNNGMQSVDDLEMALECDSTLWDVYLGLGVYKYWKSTKLKLVLWLPFVSDRREEGIQDIKIAIENDCNSRYLAIHQLVYILTDFKEYDMAIQYGKMAIDAYPNSQFMWWAYGHAFYKKPENEKAIEANLTLLSLIEADTRANPLHLMAIHLKLAELYQRIDDHDKVKYHCKMVLEQDYPNPMPESGIEHKKNATKFLENIDK
jgi:tetratricopeptide (TPR) repeat protein